MSALAATISDAFHHRESIGPDTHGPVRDAVEAVLDGLDAGALRVAEKVNGEWIVHQWVKEAILLAFRLSPARPIGGGYDKPALKWADWSADAFEFAGFRAVPGAVARRGAFIGPGAVLMPCFVNIGAHIGADTMIDTWATVGSCAQVGARCHISGGVGIGGVLEPLQARPTIIEDDVFIGARSEVAEGVVIEEGAVLSMGVFLGQSTKIVDRASGEVTYGRVPAGAVVVPGSLPSPSGGPALACAVIVKRVDAGTRAKTAINELLRD